jgi:hypothetical protein
MSIIQFTPSLPPPSIDRVGTPVSYTRWNGSRNVILTGKVMAVHTFIPRRCPEPVCEYFIIPDKGASNLSFHVVDESDIVGVLQ